MYVNPSSYQCANYIKIRKPLKTNRNLQIQIQIYYNKIKKNYNYNLRLEIYLKYKNIYRNSENKFKVYNGVLAAKIFLLFC